VSTFTWTRGLCVEGSWENPLWGGGAINVNQRGSPCRVILSWFGLYVAAGGANTVARLCVCCSERRRTSKSPGPGPPRLPFPRREREFRAMIALQAPPTQLARAVPYYKLVCFFAGNTVFAWQVVFTPHQHFSVASKKTFSRVSSHPTQTYL
jgi:hypothetical protein